uniref:Uncharacterized protein n=1 Tax=Anguilla anguilla TaxID=7936 RepID=A0A0E9UX77_ANGAN
MRVKSVPDCKIRIAG